MPFHASLFLLTGLAWLVFSAGLGLALFLGMVLGLSLPRALHVLHVHSALVGGIAQIIVGIVARDRNRSHPVLYTALNGGTVALLAGFVLGHAWLIAGAGLLVVLAFLSLAGNAVKQTDSPVPPPLTVWFYGIAWLALLIGLVTGEAMALRLLPSWMIGQGRLAHIHLTLLGFVTLTFIGAMHHLFPAVLNRSLHSPQLARWTFALLPAGILALIAGFLAGHLLLDLAAGAVVVIASGFYVYNIARTWTDAGRPRLAASDHFMLATVFLMLAIVTGMLVTVNALWHPALKPFGKLHLIAYTHLALVGFMLLTIVGAVSHLLPLDLATARIKSNKKRAAYLAELTGIVERRQELQLTALSLGTIGLALVASLVWQFSLGDLPVRIATWISAALLTLGLALFIVKLVQVLTHRPPSLSAD
jgi:cbb3-type cytochrome oxidase subunit 1